MVHLLHCWRGLFGAIFRRRLEAAGWVTRRRDTGDERQVRLRLTEAGRDLGTAAGLVPACFLDRTGMGREEAAVLRDAVMALRDRLRPR